MNRELGFRARSVVKRGLAGLGIEIKRVGSFAQTGGIGVMGTFLSDLHTRGLRPNVVLDVGANRGDWTRLARSVFPDARFVLIEPQREMAGYLDAVCAPGSNCRWFEVGAGASAGELTLTIWDDLVGSSFLAPEHDAAAGERPTRVVPIVTIDELLAREGYAPPELVKLDIQGFELEALRGAKGVFDVAEMFVMEVSLFEFLPDTPLLAEIVAFMDERDFVVYDVAGFAKRELDGALGQLDLCFARRDGLLRKSSKW
jgi:FkbM family methyltransferase